MIVNDWEPWFTEKYGHNFPMTYMCVDTEFTGSDASKDLIVDIGHVIVENGRVVDERTVLVNWVGHPGVDQAWLRYRLDQVRDKVKGNWDYSMARMKAEGLPPAEAFGFYAKLFAIWKRRNMPFALQNGITADERLIRGNFERFLSRSFEFPENSYFDTGAIYKATQIVSSDLPHVSQHKMTAYPQPADTLKSYFQRVIHAPIRGISWSLKHILTEYGLDVKHNVNTNSLHGASYDALCVHWIMEEMRCRVHRSNIVECPFDSGQAMQRVFERDAALKPRPTHEVLVQDKEPFDASGPRRAVRTTAAISPKDRQRKRQRPA